jgi:colanic acid/amylovoran biosynthesis glycosyltransferase
MMLHANPSGTGFGCSRITSSDTRVWTVKLALVTNQFPSLSETFIYTKALALHRAGVDVTVIAATPSRDAAHFPAKLDVPVHLMDVSRDVGQTARHLAARLARLSGHELRLWEAARQRYGMSRRALRAWVIAMPLAGYDVVHIEYTGMAVAYLDALVLLDAKLVVSCRGTAERMTPIAEPQRAAELGGMFAAVDRVHCVSQDLLEICVGYGLDRAKAFVNNPAIDLERFKRTQPYPAGRDGYRIVSTGRLHWAKGIEWGILAVREVVAMGIEAHYEVIGGGPEEGRLRFLVHDLGMTKHVTLAGRQSREEVRKRLEAADLYLLPSVSEGISNAVLEAMAMEIPVVSTDVGGMREAISGEEGWLVPSRAPREMAAAIADLLREPDRRIALGRAGRRRIERQFTVERQTKQFMAEYEALARP